MKIGSLVECIDEFCNYEDGEIHPLIGKIYTVRTIEGGRWKYIRLFEIMNDPNPIDYEFQEEISFIISNFRELQPPIANIEEHINENTLTPALIK